MPEPVVPGVLAEAAYGFVWTWPSSNLWFDDESAKRSSDIGPSDIVLVVAMVTVTVKLHDSQIIEEKVALVLVDGVLGWLLVNELVPT